MGVVLDDLDAVAGGHVIVLLEPASSLERKTKTDSEREHQSAVSSTCGRENTMFDALERFSGKCHFPFVLRLAINDNSTE
jgi:hypothetical protein